jgi:hypothetical protein
LIKIRRAFQHLESIVVASLQDHDLFIGDEVDKPVLISDAARPRSRKGVPQRLWFADSSERVAEHLVDES